jgi:hypothetical protein
MPRSQVQVLSPRTWGEFGNVLAATRFARALRDATDAEVTLVEAESILPWLGDIGAEIRAITLASPDADTRSRRYLGLMDRLARRFPRGFEVDPDPSHCAQVASLVEHFRRTWPDVVVGTKGLISRLALLASRVSGGSQAVVNYVTNPGLLQLEVHRSAHFDMTLVPVSWAKELLLTDGGGPADRIRVVGLLVAQHDLRGFLTTDAARGSDEQVRWGRPGSGSRPKVVVFSNRGGVAYPRILRHLADRHPEVDLVFIGYDDPDLAREAAAISVADWRIHVRLTQDQYFEYISQAARSDYAFLISKAGPNTTLEAAYFGIPVLMLESGLPMESWVPALIHDNGLGRCCAEVEELIDVLDDWLARPTTIAAYKRSAVQFGKTALDQQAVVERIRAAVGALPALRPSAEPGDSG